MAGLKTVSSPWIRYSRSSLPLINPQDNCRIFLSPVQICKLRICPRIHHSYSHSTTEAPQNSRVITLTIPFATSWMQVRRPLIVTVNARNYTVQPTAISVEKGKWINQNQDGWVKLMDTRKLGIRKWWRNALDREDWRQLLLKAMIVQLFMGCDDKASGRKWKNMKIPKYFPQGTLSACHCYNYFLMHTEN